MSANTEAVRRYRQRHPERVRANYNKWRKAHPKRVIEYVTRYQRKNLAKKRAQSRVYYAVKTGRMAKGACEVCGATKVDAHHDDYDQPLKVRWLCRKHHYEFHKRRD